MIGSFLPSLSFAHARDNNTVPNSIFIGVRDRDSYQGTKTFGGQRLLYVAGEVALLKPVNTEQPRFRCVLPS
jgi:hypothetical protein